MHDLTHICNRAHTHTKQRHTLHVFVPGIITVWSTRTNTFQTVSVLKPFNAKSTRILFYSPEPVCTSNGLPINKRHKNSNNELGRKKILANLHHNQNTQESLTTEVLMPGSVISTPNCIIPHVSVISKLQCTMWKGVHFLKGKKVFMFLCGIIPWWEKSKGLLEQCIMELRSGTVQKKTIINLYAAAEVNREYRGVGLVLLIAKRPANRHLGSRNTCPKDSHWLTLETMRSAAMGEWTTHQSAPPKPNQTPYIYLTNMYSKHTHTNHHLKDRI